MTKRPDKVLIIRLSALGDVAMTLPVVYSACRQHPDVDFYMLTRPFFAKIFINPPVNLHIITADFKTEYHGALGLIRLVNRLSKMHFTAVADLHNILRSWVIDAAMRMCGKKVRMVNKGRSHRRSDNSAKREQRSYIDRYVDVFNALGYNVSLDFCSIYSEGTPSLQTPIEHPAVGIAPFARYATKTYPVELMEQVVEGLTQKGVNVYLFGGKGKEADIMELWAQKYPSCHNLAAKMPIEQEISTMANLDIMVSMDSANQHLTSLTGTPVITIWGGTSPICGFTPYNYNQSHDLMLSLDCQPCSVAGTKACPLGHTQCLSQLTPSEVINKVMKILDSENETR